MFVAKFNQTKSAPFTADRNGNMPFIGTLVAGKATGTIINGTIFEEENLEENKLYLCQNNTREWTNPDTGEISIQHDVVVLGTVSPIEAVQMQKELGKPNLVRDSQKDPTPDPDPVRQNLIGDE